MTNCPHQTVRTLEALELNDVKIYEARNNTQTNLTRGKLEVLYSQEFDRFILRVNSFKYVLSRYFPILSFLDENAFRSYILPGANGGFYILRMKTSLPSALIQNFETILGNYSFFSYKFGQEMDLSNQAKGIGNVNANIVSSKKKTTSKMPGGEFVKQNIIKAADLISKGFSSKTTNANATQVKSIQELKNASFQETEVVDFTRTEVTFYISMLIK